MQEVLAAEHKDHEGEPKKIFLLFLSQMNQ